MDASVGLVSAAVFLWTISRMASMCGWDWSGLATTVSGGIEGTGEPFMGAAVVTGGFHGVFVCTTRTFE